MATTTVSTPDGTYTAKTRRKVRHPKAQPPMNVNTKRTLWAVGAIVVIALIAFFATNRSTTVTPAEKINPTAQVVTPAQTPAPADVQTPSVYPEAAAAAATTDDTSSDSNVDSNVQTDINKEPPMDDNGFRTRDNYDQPANGAIKQRQTAPVDAD